MILILMGVSGCGKTAIGNLLSKKINLPFFDGDDFHPAANVEKMRSGTPLTDQDRIPWLEQLAEKIEQLDNQNGGIIACSALKDSYRKILHRNTETDVRLIYLKGTKELIAKRLALRDHHFMPEELLDSQFNTLEEPENAIAVSIEQSPEQIVDEIAEQTGFPGTESAG